MLIFFINHRHSLLCQSGQGRDAKLSTVVKTNFFVVVVAVAAKFVLL